MLGLAFSVGRDYVGNEFCGETFVVEWAIFVGRTSDYEGFQHWLNNLADVRNIERWDCEGFVGILAMWEPMLRHGCFPPSSGLHLSRPSYCWYLLKRHNRTSLFLSLLQFSLPRTLNL